VSEAYWLARAPVPISGSRGSHGGQGGRTEIATPNRSFLRGRGAATETLNGAPRLHYDTEFGIDFFVPRSPQKTTVQKKTAKPTQQQTKHFNAMRSTQYHAGYGLAQKSPLTHTRAKRNARLCGYSCEALGLPGLPGRSKRMRGGKRMQGDSDAGGGKTTVESARHRSVLGAFRRFGRGEVRTRPTQLNV